VSSGECFTVVSKDHDAFILKGLALQVSVLEILIFGLKATR